MKRRDFITLLGGAASWPLAARAQQPGKPPRVGYIRAGTPNNDQVLEEFVRGMRDLGYVEGRNSTYEFRYYGDDIESIPSLVNDLLGAKVDVIVAGGAPAIRAAQIAVQQTELKASLRKASKVRGDEPCRTVQQSSAISIRCRFPDFRMRRARR